MKVILLEDVQALGKKGEIVTVSDGYARNLLLPKKMAAEVTAKNLNDLKLQKANDEKVAQENLDAARRLAGEIEGKEIILTLKCGEGGKAFGSISTKEISEGIKDQLHKEIDKKKIQLSSPIKELGTSEVSIRLHPKVAASVKITVKAQ